MPAVSRWFARTGLLYLLLGLAIGVVASVAGRSRLGPVLGALSPVRIHLLVVGWATQLIVAVMIWMFPKASVGRPRGSEFLSWAGFVTLNAGLILRVIAEPFNALAPHPSWGIVLAVSAVLQWSACLLLAANLWPRVKER